jgi:hypothetical protein
VAFKANTAFANYFTAASEVRATHPKADASSEATKAGATGLEPATSAVTGQRSNRLSYAPAIAWSPVVGRLATAVCQGLSNDPGVGANWPVGQASIGLPPWRSSVPLRCSTRTPLRCS